ncbi:hypothetical protein ACJ72_08698 [Emergomyces africanus]|uniref:Uncharacterized protein n=1 Tax=Emergomyces africanus TaxID=1955775 RepID=A0A1B7NJP4_9EURO|nr:hypothetical protein ACJ72_08698 [Emergomyces africanus]
MVSSLDTGVTSTPTLFGLHPDEGLDEAKMGDIDKLKGRESDGLKSKPKPSTTSADKLTVEFTDYDSVHDLLQDTSGEKHIRSLSKNAWVSVGSDRYVLNAPSGRITITKDDSGLYSVSHVKALSHTLHSKSPFSRPREIASSLELAQAVHAADTLASRIFLPVFVATWQPWRKKYASHGQIAFLNKHLPFDNQIRPGEITKGEAADMITKVKHGARGQFKNIVAVKRRLSRERAKESRLEELKSREEVKVGPLN